RDERQEEGAAPRGGGDRRAAQRGVLPAPAAAARENDGEEGGARPPRRPVDPRRRHHAHRRHAVRRLAPIAPARDQARAHAVGLSLHNALSYSEETRAPMQLRAEEISSIIKKQIQGYEKAALTMETGTVLSVGDGIARVYGLEGAMAGELLDFPGNLMGLVLNLESDNVGVALFGD